MKTFEHTSITEIPTDGANVHAFKITGHLDDDASEELAEHMNGVFDRGEDVNMLLDLTAFTGSDWDAMFDGDVLESRYRALKHVKRYAVVGAPERASKMIGIMDKVIPVEAKAFDKTDMDAAWAFVGAKPLSAAA